VNLATIAVRNIGRNKLRTSLTVLGVMVTILAFVLLRTVIWSWTAQVEASASDRVGTRHKISFIMTLPKRYAEEIKQVPGVTKVAYFNWFGAKDPKDENDFFATIATDPHDLFEVYDELKVPAEQKQSFFENRRGAVVGDSLAKKKGWKVGDKVTLKGTIFPGDWEFYVSGIYTATRSSVDRSTLYFHWDYLNDAVEARRKDQIGWDHQPDRQPGALGRDLQGHRRRVRRARSANAEHERARLAGLVLGHDCRRS